MGWLLFSTSAALGQGNGVYREVYWGISGSSIFSLTNGDSNYPNFPSSTEVLTNAFETPRNVADYFGERLRALVTPPVTGTYVFWIAADDTGVLFVSADESAGNKVPVASLGSMVLFHAWYTYPSQQSTNIFLEAGRRYYLEALHSAGFGDDMLSVGWKLPDGTLEQPIPALRLQPFGLAATTPPALTRQPTNVAVLETLPAVFMVGVSNLDAVSYQWLRNGAPLAGANAATYTLAQTTLADNGARFQCVISNSFAARLSTEATLTVAADTNPPVLLNAANVDLATVEVVFNEPVEPASATNFSNYSLNHGAAIWGASFGTSPRVVQLATSPLPPGTNYILTVGNIRDRAAARNTLLLTQAVFTAYVKGYYRELFAGIPGSQIQDLTNSALFPGSPALAEFRNGPLEVSGIHSNNFGQRLRALLLPPVSGNYNFWIAADDTARLSLGTNEVAAGAPVIASVSCDSMVAAREWSIQPGQKSTPIPLLGGQRYYLEVLVKNAMTANFPPGHVSVRWQFPDGFIEEPIPVSRLSPFGMSPPVIGMQPVGLTAPENSAAVFSVASSNLDAISYQWRRNGTALPGATNAVYTEPVVALALDGSTYQCVLSNPVGATISADALLRVVPDTTPPALANVLNSAINRVVVFFSEPVDPEGATNRANYSLSAGTISAASLRDAQSVTLNVSGLVLGRTYTLTVNGVRDRASTPNIIPPNSQWAFTVAEFFPQDIGGPAAVGGMSPGGNGLDIIGAGRGLAGTSDQCNFTYEKRVGDFDVKVRLQCLGFVDIWTMAGLMAREDLTTNSRYAAVLSTPTLAGTFFQYRASTGAVAQTAGAFPVNYPYTWLRLQRLGGSRFTGFASLDGQTWTQLGSVTLPFSSTIYLGYAVASHDPARSIVAQFRDFADSSADAVGFVPALAEPLGPSNRRTGLAFTELMYHPAPRADGRSLEFAELYNSNPYPEDLSGFRLSGDIDYVFPPGTILAGGAFLVIASSPSDIQAIYGITNVAGPYQKHFSNKTGTLRLRNKGDAILLEVNYDSVSPWPVAADGTGHSLVLSRPSYGEANATAWTASDRIGGSPGLPEGFCYEPLRNVVINEFLAHTDPPDLDYIELYNHGNVPVDLSGCWLSDNPNTYKFRIPDGTSLGPTSYVYYTEATLGFSLSAGGEEIYFVHSNLTRVLDAVRFAGQESGVSFGRSPNGGPVFQRLAAKTPGAPNASPRLANVIINEIMYHPISDDENDAYVELYNRGTNAVSLGGWRFIEGIDFTFPTNVTLAAGGYMVIAKNAAHLMTNYANLNSSNTLGNYGGQLGNGGERLALAKPDFSVSTNSDGKVSTNQFYTVVNEVAYGTGGRWGAWSDGGGSSLELIDPHSDIRSPSNWSDSDETAKSVWSTLSVTGMLDNGPGSDSKNNSLQLYLLDAGECLVDSVSVSIAGSSNLVTNPDFENPALKNWFFQGTHRRSRIESPGFSGSNALHVIASDKGDDGANRIYTLLTSSYTTNVTGTISAKVKWLHGRPEILFRLRGNHLELAGTQVVPRNLGTPGARNSRYATNSGPAIVEVAHRPVLPADGQSVVVTARVQDPDGVASVQLVYRLDPYGSPVTVPMLDNGSGGDAVPGDGIYSATIPGQTANTLVAFYVQATDAYVPPATARFPNDAPTRECLVRFGETQPGSCYGTYRFWLTQDSFNGWVSHEKLSNEANPGTFVYGDFRAIYNAGSHFAGSPFHADMLDTPTGSNCDYYVALPVDDTLLNSEDLWLQSPGNFGRDALGQTEQMTYWMAAQLGVPYLYRRSVNVFVNGVHRNFIYDDTQRPGGDYEAEFFPSAANGELCKIQYWFEFTDAADNHTAVPASLMPFTTTGGVKKLARYRQSFPKKAIQGSPNDYTNFFALVDTVNTTESGDAYMARLSPVLDIPEWSHVFALERIVNNSDLYGNLKQSGSAGGQNGYLFKPDADSWKFIIWDIDFCFSGLATDPLFNFTDPPITNLFGQAAVLRGYWQALEDAALGPLDPAKVWPQMDARYNAFQAAGIPAGAPDGIKNFVAVRRDYILWLISEVRADFGITSNGGNNFTNPSNLLTLTGTAPLTVRTITVNGAVCPPSWNTLTNWSMQLLLTNQTNVLVLQGYDALGNPMNKASRTITVYFNGVISRPEDSLVINEIMFNPAVSNAAYVEIFNRSANTTFSLSDFRLHGVDFDFPAQLFIGPQSYVVVAEDVAAFRAAYAFNGPVAGPYLGHLDPDGETLALWKKAPSTNQADIIIDKVKYSAAPPWPARSAQPGSGMALQLIDSAQDNARVSNWDDGAGWRFFSATGTPGGTRLYLYLDTTGEVLLDDIRLVPGSVPAVGSNYLRNGDFEQSLGSAWAFLGSSGANTSILTNGFAPSGTNSLRLIFTRSGDTSHCLYQDITALTTTNTYTLSFWYRPTTNANNLTVRAGGGGFSPVLNLHPISGTPSALNSVAGNVPAYPLLWINEVQPNNPNGLPDNTGTPQPWLELFNSGTNAIALDGLTLSRSYSDLRQWAFPAGASLAAGQFRIIFADGQPQLTTGTVWHTSFRLAPTNGSVVLARGNQILDYINYTNMEAGLSCGSWPDGQLFDRQVFYFTTPGASNNPAPVPVAINEWMASNTRTLANPARPGRFDDWFELYNFGTKAVNLSGYYLSDDPANRKSYCIPNGTILAPQQFLLCWADNDRTGTNTIGNALHTSFQLSRNGDEIALSDPQGLAVDTVAFGYQYSDVSQGRFKDGNVAGVYYFMPSPTPGTNNLITNNFYAPVLTGISNYTVDEGTLLQFTVHATDADTISQTLTYSLLPGAPEGASIEPLTGVFSWTPLEYQGPGSYSIAVRVSDNGVPPLNDTNTFMVLVNEVNLPPAILTVPDQTIDAGQLLTVAISATDPDLPAQTFAWHLLTGPSGAALNTNGTFVWIPSQAQASSTNPVVLSVTDSGTPPLSATQSFVVVVRAGNVCSGYKGDVDPRFAGNGTVNASDWMQVGRFAAGLADISNACELARADCAPKPCGNGLITIADWVQAGRYAAGLEPVVQLCAGGAGLAPLGWPAGVVGKSQGASGTSLVLSNLVLAPGETNWLRIYLLAQGGENALGFSFSFETNLLTYLTASLGADASTALLYVNSNKVAEGRIGLALSRPAGEAFPPGLCLVAEVAFRAANVSEMVNSSLTIGDQPILREVADVEANTVPCQYANGTVVITSVPFFDSVRLGPDRQLILNVVGPPARIVELQGAVELGAWGSLTTLSNSTGFLEFKRPVPDNSNLRFYRTVLP